MLGDVALGADHAGFSLKEALKEFLDDREISYKDYGCFSTERTDYPDVAFEVAKAIKAGEYSQGILCCGSGVGMAMTANRIPGIRAVVCSDIYIATMSRRHNDANIICFGGRIIAADYGQELLDIFLNTPFEGARHQRRVEKMDIIQ
jgi:ribose 5-phosphate isomerase B